MGVVRPAECERAHLWVSLGLDAELSELEQALLRAHVARCAACAGFAHNADAVTRELRAAPFERPSVAGMPPRRRLAMRSLQVGAAAAAVALAAGLGSLAGSLNSRSPAVTTATTGHGASASGNVAAVPVQRLPRGRVIAL